MTQAFGDSDSGAAPFGWKKIVEEAESPAGVTRPKALRAPEDILARFPHSLNSFVPGGENFS